MPLTDAQAIELTVSYLNQLDLLGEMVGAAIREVFDNMSAYDRAQLEEFIQSATPAAEAGMAEGADLAGAYLSELHQSTITAEPVELLVEGLDGPFLRYWHDLKEGQSWDQARESGSSMAEMTGQDITRDGAGARMANPGTKTKVIGYQRVVHPGACEFCQVVATQMYRSYESALLGGYHHKCRCVPPIPVTNENAQALRKINRTRLKGLRSTGAVERISAARARSKQRQ